MRELLKQALLAVAIFIALVLAFIVSLRIEPVLTPHVTRDGLYGVFLTNGQVYFGNITTENKQIVRLEHIYYFQFKGLAATEAQSAGSDVTLQKLGNELHGPEDWMEINRDQILFVERLKTDGKVAKAIETYRAK